MTTKLRVLVVDDEPDKRLLLAFALENEGYEVLTAADGVSGLQAVELHQPDLIVTDVMMPRMDGFQVLEGLSTYGVGSETRVLVLTARGSEADRMKGLQRGADRYLGKPFATDEFMATVRELLAASTEDLRAGREKEIEKARLLATLETVFEEPR